jgi:uncharacterized membrane protein YgdD (TMEM256/DUF423 family)
MRALNIASALSGALAIVMLAVANHVFAHDAHISFLYIAAGTQLAAACAGLAISNRAGRLNAIAGAMIVGGAFVFSGAIYLEMHRIHIPVLAPIGGAPMILGWLVLAFAKPRA